MGWKEGKKPEQYLFTITETFSENWKSFKKEAKENNQNVSELLITSKCDRHLVQVANDNDPSQVVISGEKKEVEKFSNFLKQKNAKRIINLPVSLGINCKTHNLTFQI